MTSARAMVLLKGTQDRYLRAARDHPGSAGMVLEGLRALARREARRILHETGPLHRQAVAEALQRIAAATYQQACKEGWANAAALDIDRSIHDAVVALD